MNITSGENILSFTQTPDGVTLPEIKSVPTSPYVPPAREFSEGDILLCPHGITDHFDNPVSYYCTLEVLHEGAHRAHTPRYASSTYEWSTPDHGEEADPKTCGICWVYFDSKYMHV